MRVLVASLATVFAVPTLAVGAEQANSPSAEVLYTTVAELDAAAFDAFNQCSEPAQLAKHGDYFAEDVEFYHDNGGVTWSRDEMLANTRKYVCGNFRRELVPGSLKVHPIKDFGAIALGSHRFCQFASGKCEGIADFTMIWRHKDGAWLITRVLSYGHRPSSVGP